MDEHMITIAPINTKPSNRLKINFINAHEKNISMFTHDIKFRDNRLTDLYVTGGKYAHIIQRDKDCFLGLY